MLPNTRLEVYSKQIKHSFSEKHIDFISGIFRTYCSQKKVYLTPSTQRVLFEVLLQAVWCEWSKEQTNEVFSPVALLAEITHLQCQLVIQNNQGTDLLLLKTQPAELVVKYQAMIEFVVKKKLKQSNDCSLDNQSDIIANIREHILSKLVNGKISKQYKGNALFSTYLYRIANYCLLDELRKRKCRIETTPIEYLPAKYSLIADREPYSDVLEEYLQNFRILLGMMFERERKRFEFTLQVVYHLPMKASDIQRIYPNCSETLLVEILSVFGGDTQNRALSYADIYQFLGNFVTELEHKKKPILPSSFRGWFQKRLNQVKQTVFEGLSFDSKSETDRYFEVLYVYAIYLSKVDLLPPAIVEYVWDNPQIRKEILELYKLYSKALVEEYPHPYFLENKPIVDTVPIDWKNLDGALEEIIRSALEKQFSPNPVAERRVLAAYKASSSSAFQVIRPEKDTVSIHHIPFVFNQVASKNLDLHIKDADGETIAKYIIGKGTQRFEAPIENKQQFPSGLYYWLLLLDSKPLTNRFYICTEEDAKDVFRGRWK